MLNMTKKTVSVGTCPVCFGSFKVTAKGVIIRHGWSVQGSRTVGSYHQSWHTGPCFGVGYQPFEVSTKGTMDFFTQVIIPAGQRAFEAREALNARPTFYLVINGEQVDWVDARSRSTPGYAVYAEIGVRIQDGDAAYALPYTFWRNNKPKYMRDIPSYEATLVNKIDQADSAIASVINTARFLSEKVCEWTKAA